MRAALPAVVLACSLAGLVAPSRAELLVSFDEASASSLYAGGAFGAQEALSQGSGYWCRRGYFPDFHMRHSCGRSMCVNVCVHGAVLEIMLLGRALLGLDGCMRDSRPWGLKCIGARERVCL